MIHVRTIVFIAQKSFSGQADGIWSLVYAIDGSVLYTTVALVSLGFERMVVELL